MLFAKMNMGAGDPVPIHFQAVFEVTVSRLNGEGAPETVVPLKVRSSEGFFTGEFFEGRKNSISRNRDLFQERPYWRLD